MSELVPPNQTEEAEPEKVVTVTYELLEEFTGSRTHEVPDSEPITIDVNDINVRFTCTLTNKTQERSVNVCFDSDGNYDADATALRIGEVAEGIASKFACGAIV